jgi:uncharacterized MAPEG superfamily protein
MISNKKGVIQIIAAIVLALVIMAVIWSLIPASQLTVESKVEIDPTKIKNSQSSILLANLHNTDQNNEHEVVLRFATYNLVHILIGNNELERAAQGSEDYVYRLNLAPAQKTEQPFMVKVGKLPVGIASQEFSIKVDVYTDGEIISSHKVKFTVEED